jgi:Sel1 repeat
MIGPKLEPSMGGRTIAPMLEARKCSLMMGVVKTGATPRPGGCDLLQRDPMATRARRSRRGRAWKTLKPRCKTSKSHQSMRIVPRGFARGQSHLWHPDAASRAPGARGLQAPDSGVLRIRTGCGQGVLVSWSEYRSLKERKTIMSSPIQTAKDKDRDSLLMYAPSWARKKPPVVAAHEPPIEQPPRSHVVDAAGPTFSGDLAVEDLRRRRSLTPEIVPEPKFLKGDRPRALIALCVSGVTAIAALIALVVVSLPAMHQRPANNNIHTALLPNQADVQRDQSPTATAQPSLNERRTQANEPPPNGGSEKRQSGMTTVMAGPVTDAIMPATASSPTVPQLKRTTAQPDDEEISALIKLGRDFVKSSDFSSARLLLRRAAEAGSAAAALSLGETFDPLVIQQLHAIGVQPDTAKAREWYERAAQLGSDAASQHLAKLAQSPQ